VHHHLIHASFKLIHASLGPPESKSQTASGSVQPFLRSSLQSVPILHDELPLVPYPLKIAPSHGGSGHPSNTWFLGPTWVLNPNGNSIGFAIFAGLTIVTVRQTMLLSRYYESKAIFYVCSTEMWPDDNNRGWCLWCCHHGKPLWQFTKFIWWMQTETQVATNPQTKSTNLGYESTGWLLPSTSTIAIYYYSAQKLISFYRPVEGGRLSWPRYCNNGMLKGVHCSGCHYQHNCLWCGSSLGPRTHQPGMLV